MGGPHGRCPLSDMRRSFGPDWLTRPLLPMMTNDQRVRTELGILLLFKIDKMISLTVSD